MFHIFTSLTAGASRRLAAVVSNFDCEMRANYIEKYLHCEKWGDVRKVLKILKISLLIIILHSKI
ncbi:MAG: hypothetical protein FXF49_06445 [Flexistipes sinusarabici]|uniref:Uncharacterized protein n=1 Tax=Flexistipes sinusarabici TaxID=2352 RepID=A0A5D0MI73_FLESI|nr:MAG: hypothetical protein FXF49_06445 [Flexistipes sinusarabici]